MARITRPASRSSFTLVELLVTLGIVLVLCAAVFAAVRTSLSRARSAQCSQQIRQIGIAVLQYAAENNGVYPKAKGPSWDVRIGPFLGHSDIGQPAQVLRCPADPRPLVVGAGLFARSYALSRIREPNEGISGDVEARSQVQVTEPSRSILLTEWFTDQAGASIENYQFRAPFGSIAGWLGSAPWPRLPDGKTYHGRTMNFCFADGHVESKEPRDVCSPDNLWVTVR